MTTDWTNVDRRLLDPSFYTTDEYHRVFATLRDESPVRWVEDPVYGKNYWAVTRYADVKNVLLDNHRLSNRWNTRVPRTPKRLTPEERHAFGLDVQVATTDGATHAAYRRPMNKHFSVPAIGKMKPAIEAIVDQIIVEAAELGDVDFVEHIAGPLALRSVLSLLGAPESDWDYLRQLAWRFSASSDPRYVVNDDPVATHYAARAEVLEYAEKLALDRRENPRDDFATIIAQLTMDGDPLTTHEMKAWIFTLIVGGLESTRNACATGLYAYTEYPDQANLLREDPSLAGSALDEVLRWGSPTKNRLRIVAEDFEFQGQPFRTGDWVISFQASANRDERQFSNPDTFDIRRSPNEHLALGIGAHLCLGRALARLELQTMYAKLFDAFSEIERTEDKVEWISDTSVTGFHRLPVRLTPSRHRSAA